MTRGAAQESGAAPDLVAQLTLEQKVGLLTGVDSWTLRGIAEIGLRPVVMSDGPAGVRGTAFDRDNPSSSLPCPVALGATWDEGLVERLAGALAEEARAKGVDVLLAPTMNIIRTPLGGRAFESFSEDPFLTARLAVAYVRGVQAAGVAATAKHFVANDSETERRSYDARIAEHVLHEIYLPPFEACVTEAGVGLVMAAYNSVNGATMTANPRLLRELLKREWEFDGVVVSDWNAAQTTVASALGGLDLVMPGPHGPWGELLLSAVRRGALPEAELDDKVARLLVLARRVGALNGAAAALSAGDRPVVSHIPPDLLREAAARSFVLLADPRRLLPVETARTRRVALIGPNAVAPTLQGGGSIRVLPVARPGIAEALAAALGPDAVIDVQLGCSTSATVALPPAGALRDPVSGEPGVRLEVRDAASAVVFSAHFPVSAVTWWDRLGQAVDLAGAEIVLRGRYRSRSGGEHLVGAAGVGLLKVSVDGVELAEARTVPPHDVVEALSRPPELRVPVHLQPHQEVEVAFSCRPDVRGSHGGFANIRLGIAPRVEDEELLARAAQAAAQADLAVVIVGSPDGVESEGFDRETLALAGRQDELVSRVAAANPNTVVVVNAGMPVLMPWAGEVAAILQAWLPGQAFGEALADCLLGIAEPGGRLPVSLPAQEADAPVLHALPAGGELVYAEGLLVGYRGYDRGGVEPHFCFGHGLGYTDWAYEELSLAAATIQAAENLALTVRLRNAGGRAGREVVQVYLEPPGDDPARPLRVLAAFSPVSAGAGQSVDVELTIPARAFARFDEELRSWTWQAGRYVVRVGRSSRDLRLSAALELR